MTPQDDWLPTEREEPYTTLITLLQRAYSASTAIPPDRQAQIIARVQERLLETASGTPLSQTVPGQLREAIDLSSLIVASPTPLPRRRGRFIRLSAMLAAVLVLGTLVGTALLFSLSRPQTTDAPPPPIGPVGKPVTIHTSAGGLEATMQVTPGPYFLGELLEVDLSLTNHSKITFQGDRCHLFPTLIMIDGEGVRDTNLSNTAATTIYSMDAGVKIFPHDTSLASVPTYITPTSPSHSLCYPTAPFDLVSLQPAKTITVKRYVALTSSGNVTISVRAAFQKFTPVVNGSFKIVPAANPLDGHWPFLHISVSTRVPSNRMLSLRQQPTQVSVSVPATAREHVLYAFYYVCGLGSIVSESGFEMRGDYKISQPAMTLQKPPCGYRYFGSTPAKLLRWVYVIGVPGYAMVSGKYP